MKMVLRVIVFVAAVRLLAAQEQGMTGQQGSIGASMRSQSDLVQRTYTVAGEVKTLRGDPIRGANVVVRVWNYMGDIRQLHTDDRGEFRTEFTLSLQMVEGFGVDMKVTKRHYLPAHEIVDFGSSGKTRLMPITLRDSKTDPELLSQKDLIADLALRLKQLGASDGLTDKAAKDYARGVKEFLDRDDPDRALTYFAKVIKRDTSCAACRTMWGLAQLASSDWDGAERNFTEAIKAIRDDPSKARPEPDIAYGVMESWRHEPKHAAALFLEAIKIAPQDSLALKELGRSQLLQEKWPAAEEYLHKAIAAGAGPDARLMRAEALLHADDPNRADREMTAYLNGRDVKRMPLRVRQLTVEIKAQHKPVERSVTPVFSLDRPVKELIKSIPELKGLEPASDESLLDSILDRAGKSVAVSFRDFPNTVSVEQIHQEKLQSSGRTGKVQDQEFQYLCLAAPTPSGPGFSEYRADKSGSLAAQKGLQEGFMLTSGFTSAALYFHPLYRADARFRYLGRQKENGRDYFVVSFAQVPGKARLLGAFRVNGAPTPTFSQGLAWIDAESYQIVRIRQDLLAPLPELHLQRQTTEIDFGAVRFKKIPEEFWLPQRVTVAVNWNGKRLRNEHRYSDFQLFNVHATENENQRRTPAPPFKDESGPGAL